MALPALAQMPALMPIPEQQFFTPFGEVCSGCFVYTYVSGSFTPLGTYTDYTGDTANTNPVQLNSAGFPETASGTQVGIWLSPTATYRIVLQNASHVTLYQVDGITGQLTGTISNPLTILDATCNQLTIGLVGFQTGLCFPAPSSNITLTFPSAASDTMVARNTVDTLTNKTLTSAVLNTPSIASPTVTTTTIVPNLNPDRQSVSVANSSSTGTTLNGLAKLSGAPSTAIATSGFDTGGIMGVVTAGAGTTGSATIQQNGVAFCNFDGPTTAGDYVQNSAGSAPDCHDVGASGAYPSTGQVVGRVLSTNAGAGTYAMQVFPPEQRASTGAGQLPVVVYNTAGGPTNTSIGSTNMISSVAVNTLYRISAYFEVDAAGSGCTTATSLLMQFTFTDPAGSSTTTYNLLSGSFAGNSAPGQNAAAATGFLFRAKLGTTISYSVTYTPGSGCSPGLTYSVLPILEQVD